MRYLRVFWSIAAVASVCFSVHGCGSDSGRSGGDTSDSGSLQYDAGDTEADGSSGADPVAPTFSDLKVTFADEVAEEASLNEENQTREVRWPVEASFHVLATDDTDAAKDLAVDVIDTDNQLLTPIDSAYEGGIWQVTVEVRPGQALRVRLTDPSGNETTSAYMLILPPYTATDAVIGVWHQPNYPFDSSSDPEPSVTTFAEDGTFQFEHGVFSISVTGNWSISGNVFTYEETTVSGSDVSSTDSDPETVEWSFDCKNFYVGPTYFERAPLVRISGDSGIEGTWRGECTWNTSPSGDTGQGSNEYVFNEDGSWSSTITTPSDTRTSRGTWELEPYEGDAQWLVRKRTHRDGEPHHSTTAALVVVRDEMLLFNPSIRQ